MVYTTPHPDDDEQLAAWRRRQAEDTARSINIRLPLGLARRLHRGGRAGCLGRPLRRRPAPRRPGRPPRRSTARLRFHAPDSVRACRSGPSQPPRPAHHPALGRAHRRADGARPRRQGHRAPRPARRPRLVRARRRRRRWRGCLTRGDNDVPPDAPRRGVGQGADDRSATCAPCERPAAPGQLRCDLCVRVAGETLRTAMGDDWSMRHRLDRRQTAGGDT